MEIKAITETEMAILDKLRKGLSQPTQVKLNNGLLQQGSKSVLQYDNIIKIISVKEFMLIEKVFMNRGITIKGRTTNYFDDIVPVYYRTVNLAYFDKSLKNSLGLERKYRHSIKKHRIVSILEDAGCKDEIILHNVMERITSMGVCIN